MNKCSCLKVDQESPIEESKSKVFRLTFDVWAQQAAASEKNITTRQKQASCGRKNL